MIGEIVAPHTARAFAAMSELRPHLASVEAFVEQVDTVQRPAGYRLVGVFEEGRREENDTAADSDAADSAAAVAGFRESTNLSWGHHLYVDDLSTRAISRGRGLARQLLDWIHDEAVRLGCGEVHLDSGVGPARHDAHRLYLTARYVITAHHFVRPVE